MSLWSLFSRRMGMFIVALALVAVAAPARGHEGKELDYQPPYNGPDTSNGPGGALPISFPSSGITLLSWISVPTFNPAFTTANTVEGYVSQSGREYAVIGLSGGTAFVEVTNPTQARIVAQIAGPTSLWRDLRVHSTYAYAVSEGGGGIQVMNLSQIDNDVVTLVGAVNTPGSASTHTVFVNNTSGYLYRCGGGSTLGVRIYSLANPAAPAYVATALGTRYTHECQVVTYPPGGPWGNKEILFCSSDTTSGGGNPRLEILDVTDKGNITLLGATAYPNPGFSHQSWLSDDRQYVYLNDEIDGSGPAAGTRIINVADLANPFYVATVDNGNPAIDHNLYVIGNRIFQSNYRSGLRVFDSTNPVAPFEMAFFDTYPDNDNPNYNGLWDNYPFLPSGIILGSDIEKGLFIWRLGAPVVEFELPNGAPPYVNPFGQTIQVEITPINGGVLQAGTAKLNYKIGAAAYADVVMTPLGGNLYEAAIPATPCGTSVSFFASVMTTDGSTWRHPMGGAISPFVALSASDEVVTWSDDMETDQGWTAGAPGDTATSGIWVRVDPVGTAAQPENDNTPGAGTMCWVTGQGVPGGGVGAADVDGGITTLTSPIFDATGNDIAYIGYYRWYSNNQGAAAGHDSMPVDISNNNGATWTQLELVNENMGVWVGKTFRIDQFVTPTNQMRIRFIARDLDEGSVVEAGVDDVRLTLVRCTSIADIDADGDVDNDDVLAFVAVLLGTPQNPLHEPRSDINADGTANGRDVQPFAHAVINGG